MLTSAYLAQAMGDWRNQAVGVEKVAFLSKRQKSGEGKCLGDPRKSFIGHPDAILFRRISREGVFQQPQAITPTENYLSS
jgi:hypothetical protein